MKKFLLYFFIFIMITIPVNQVRVVKRLLWERTYIIGYKGIVNGNIAIYTDPYSKSELFFPLDADYLIDNDECKVRVMSVTPTEIIVQSN